MLCMLPDSSRPIWPWLISHHPICISLYRSTRARLLLKNMDYDSTMLFLSGKDIWGFYQQLGAILGGSAHWDRTWDRTRHLIPRYVTYLSYINYKLWTLIYKYLVYYSVAKIAKSAQEKVQISHKQTFVWQKSMSFVAAWWYLASCRLCRSWA